MLYVQIGIKVKFRVFGFTLGTLSRLFRVDLADGFRLIDEGDAFEFPVHAQIVLNDRGVKVGYWKSYEAD